MNRSLLFRPFWCGLVLVGMAFPTQVTVRADDLPAPTSAVSALATPLVAPKGWTRDSPEALLDAAFAKVFHEVLLENGLALDRRSDRTTVSCAATGFTAYALALMAKRQSDRDEVLETIQRGFRTTLAQNPPRNGGWLYHFTDENGIGKPWSEVSTIDTAIFYLGFLRAAETLGDEAFLSEIRQALAQIDREMVLREGYFLHGFYWHNDEQRLLPYLWNDTSEGVMLYKLFDMPFEPRILRHDYPLFAYYYPLCFFDLPRYERLLHDAVTYQFGRYGYTGITAGDGPHGYQADDPTLISPLTLFALSSVFPEARSTLAKYAVDQMVPAYHVGSGWTASDRVTIDYGSAYILIVRQRRGMFENLLEALRVNEQAETSSSSE